MVSLPEPMPPPKPPFNCSGFDPSCEGNTVPFDPQNLQDDIFDDDDSALEPAIDPHGDYTVVYDNYKGDTYYNISLKKNMFDNSESQLYLMVELMDRVAG